MLTLCCAWYLWLVPISRHQGQAAQLMRLRGRYVVLSTLGAGTFGQVVKCRLQETGEEVAVKVIKNQQAFYCQARATRMPRAGHAALHSPASRSTCAAPHASSELCCCFGLTSTCSRRGSELPVQRPGALRCAGVLQARVEIGVLNFLNQRCDPHDRHHIVRMRDYFLHRRHLCLVFELLSLNLYELVKHNQFRGLSMNLLRVFLSQARRTSQHRSRFSLRDLFSCAGELLMYLPPHVNGALFLT